MPDLQEIPVEEVTVKAKPTEVQSAIGSEEFIKEFARIIKGGDVWRTPAGLAKKLNVDQADLQAWMDKQGELVRRPGKEDGTFFYAYIQRLEKPKEPKGMERKAIMEEDRYMMALLHNGYGNYVRTLEKYALRLHDKNAEAFAALAQARDRMSAGVVLLANTLGTDVEKLPKL